MLGVAPTTAGCEGMKPMYSARDWMVNAAPLRREGHDRRPAARAPAGPVAAAPVAVALVFWQATTAPPAASSSATAPIPTRSL